VTITPIYDMNGRQFLYGALITLNGDLPSDEYTFRVQVTDQANHSTTCNVKIMVTTNRIFGGLTWSQESYEASILEHSPENTTVVQVDIATSIDSEPDIPYTITYSFVDPSIYYKIDEQTGLITCTSTPIDREEIIRNRLLDQKYIYVQAKMIVNSTFTLWSSIVKVKIDIIDASDQVPFFVVPDANATMIEYASVDDQPIFNFSAVDLDQNEMITFELVSQRNVFSEHTVQLPFVISKQNGSLFLNFDDMSDKDIVTLLNQTQTDKDSVRIELVVSVTDPSNAR
jgi:hypothetical protein